MRLNDGRAIKTSFWYANEILKETDINSLGEATYQNVTDLLALRAAQREKDEVLSGLMVTPKSRMTLTLSAGAAVSFSGSYLNGGIWGFRQAKGDVFSVVTPVDTTISIDPAHATLNRVDVVEVRPKVIDYNTESRRFKDPVSSLVTTQSVDTMREYGMEFNIKKGTPGRTPKSPDTTSGWIKLAEVEVPAAIAALGFRHIKNHTAASEWSSGNASSDSPGTYETAKLQTDRELTIDADTIDDVDGILRNTPRDLNGYKLDVKLTSDIRLTGHVTLRVFENGTIRLSNENKKISGNSHILDLKMRNCRLNLVSFSCASIILKIGGNITTDEGNLRNTVFMDRVSLDMTGSSQGLLMEHCNYIEFSNSFITDGARVGNAAEFRDCPMIQNLPIYRKGSSLTKPEYSLLLIKSILLSSGAMFEGTKGDLSPASHDYILLDRIHTQNSTRTLTKDGYLKAGKSIITQRTTQNLPLNPRVGEEIDILAAASTKVKVSSADQSILYQDKYHTEGKDGYVQLKAGDHLHLIYKGEGYVDLSTWTKVPNPPHKPPDSMTRKSAFSHDDRYFAIASSHRPYLFIYKVSDDGTAFKRVASTVTFGNRTATAVAFSPDNRYMAVGNGSSASSEISGGVTVYTMDEKKDEFTYHHRYTGEGSGVTSVAFSPDSKLLFFGNLEQVVCGSLERRSVKKRVNLTPNIGVPAIAVSPDGLYVVAGLGSSPYVVVYRITSDNPLTPTSKKNDASSFVDGGKVTDVSFSSDGKFLAYSSAAADGKTGLIVVGNYTPGSDNILQQPYHRFSHRTRVQVYYRSHAFSNNVKHFVSSDSELLYSETESYPYALASRVERRTIDGQTFSDIVSNGFTSKPLFAKFSFSCSFSHNNRYFAMTSDRGTFIYNVRTPSAKQFIVTDFKTADGTAHIEDRFH